MSSMDVNIIPDDYANHIAKCVALRLEQEANVSKNRSLNITKSGDGYVVKTNSVIPKLKYDAIVLEELRKVTTCLVQIINTDYVHNKDKCRELCINIACKVLDTTSEKLPHTHKNHYEFIEGITAV